MKGKRDVILKSFHEKAGECQVCFSFFFIRIFLLFSSSL
jgi:hypothetical protein